MNKQEALAAIADGHTMYSVEFAKEVCKAFKVAFNKSLIEHWTGQKDANPDNHPKGLWLNEDKPGEGVHSLALSRHIVEQLGEADKANLFLGRGTQAREYARVVRESLEEKVSEH